MGTSEEELKNLVERFRVCWKVWPELIYIKGEKRQIGYELELSGTHEPWVEHPEPGCEHCQRVYLALRQIAEWILPKEKRPSRYEIAPFDQSIRYTPSHGNRPDVLCVIKIVHRHEWDQPVDECEERCLEEMEQRLSGLGAGHLSWTCRGRKSDAPGSPK